MKPPYTVEIEISSPLAMFSRVDTGATPTSYPVPTWSACKGIFESVAFFSGGEAWIDPTHVEICRHRDAPGGEVKFQRYSTNYGGPLRKSGVLRSGSSHQLFATVLADVCYRIYGEIRGEPLGKRNPAHHLKDLFDRRLRQGRCHRTPVLGWSEFTASYWGAFREEYVVDGELELTIPSLLHSVWERSPGGGYAPTFRQNVRVEKGVLRFAQ